jgi:hypothetical protein
MNTFYCLEEWRGKQRVSTEGTTSHLEDKVYPWGPTSPLEVKFRPWGKFKIDLSPFDHPWVSSLFSLEEWRCEQRVFTPALVDNVNLG